MAPLRGVAAGVALAPVGSGQRVFVGSGAGEPQHLVSALAERAAGLSDTEVVHLMTLGAAPYAEAGRQGGLRHNALFIGANVRQAVGAGLADYTPCFLSEVPGMFRSGRMPLDAALVMTSPPRRGRVSLGVAVDVVKAAAETAPYVVAQVNSRMPWTGGDSSLPLSAFDAFVEKEEALCELPAAPPTAAALWIGRYAASLIEDGATLQLGIGAIPDAVLARLGGKKDLGIHSEMVSDGVLALLEAGVLNGRRKTLHPGKVVTSFCLGSRRLYEAVGRDPRFAFHPTDHTNDPFVIAQNERMTAVNSALQVDLTGQVAADSLGHRFYSGVGGQVDFMRGAARAKGGRAIIALPATAKGGAVSRIVAALEPGTGVVTTRADVDFVVTEYGIAALKGRTIRERALALIGVAHPGFRAELAAAAKRWGLLDAGHVLAAGERYEVQWETRRDFGGTPAFIRPLKPTDERRLKELFYSQSPETTWLRFGVPLKRLSEKEFQALVAIDNTTSFAVGVFVGERPRQRLVAVARYFAIPGSRLAEAAFTVHDEFQGRGMGSFLVDYLAWIAERKGLEGFSAEMLASNDRMRGVFERRFARVALTRQAGQCTAVMLFKDRRGSGSPTGARDEEPAAFPGA
ncbi:MAG: GNAT family N-acetyltransferase [Elusimicrobia bacterium]|nr:GNAT family N-acetyltransferase [Elusimicrobiota bacterium]